MRSASRAAAVVASVTVSIGTLAYASVPSHVHVTDNGADPCEPSGLDGLAGRLPRR
jgi:hypothetical protein